MLLTKKQPLITIDNEIYHNLKNVEQRPQEIKFVEDIDDDKVFVLFFQLKTTNREIIIEMGIGGSFRKSIYRWVAESVNDFFYRWAPLESSAMWTRTANKKPQSLRDNV